MLSALVSSGNLTHTPALSLGWNPLLVALVTSGTLKKPGGTTPPADNGTPSWVLPAAIIGGTVIVAAALASQNKKEANKKSIDKNSE